jgi:hypothetical protein
MEQRETRDGDDPDDSQVTDAAAVNSWQVLGGGGKGGTFSRAVTERLYSLRM